MIDHWKQQPDAKQAMAEFMGKVPRNIEDTRTFVDKDTQEAMTGSFSDGHQFTLSLSKKTILTLRRLLVECGGG